MICHKEGHIVFIGIKKNNPEMVQITQSSLILIYCIQID